MEKLLTWARRANRHCLSRVKSQTRLTATGDNMSVHSDQLWKPRLHLLTSVLFANGIVGVHEYYCDLIKTYNCNKCNKRFYETKNYSTFQLNINEIARLKKNNSKQNDTKSISLLDCLGINKNNINLFCENCNFQVFSF